MHLEYAGQGRLHLHPRLAAQRLETRYIARMVVDHREGMEPGAVAQPRMALEVHLPEVIGGLCLEAQAGGFAARLRQDQSVPLQHLVHRRACGHPVTVSLKHSLDLARAPGRVLRPDREDPLFNVTRRPQRAGQRTPRAVGKAVIFSGAEPPQPLVASLGTDPEATAQLPPVCPLQQRKPHELFSLIHGRHLFPRHENLLRGPQPDVSTMSPNTCQVCPRSKQQARP